MRERERDTEREREREREKEKQPYSEFENVPSPDKSRSTVLTVWGFGVQGSGSDNHVFAVAGFGAIQEFVHS